MPHPLHQRLRRLAGQARRLNLWFAFSWFVVATLTVLLAMGGLDFLISFG